MKTLKNNNMILFCKNCKHYKKGYCKNLKYNVSYNANWCKYYKRKLINRIFNIK